MDKHRPCQAVAPRHRPDQYKGGIEGTIKTKDRRLEDLISIGPAMLRDFELLGIRSVSQLARANPKTLYERLCRATGQHQDVCCLDVFTAAVAQARNPRLPAEQCQWWYWSQRRKAAERSAGKWP